MTSETKLKLFKAEIGFSSQEEFNEMVEEYLASLRDDINELQVIANSDEISNQRYLKNFRRLLEIREQELETILALRQHQELYSLITQIYHQGRQIEQSVRSVGGDEHQIRTTIVRQLLEVIPNLYSVFAFLEHGHNNLVPWTHSIAQGMAGFKVLEEIVD